MADVRVDVLGPLRVRVDGEEQRLGGRRERVVLGLLASSVGRPVSPERLVDEVWGQDAPASASGSLQVAVSRLRGTLEPTRRSGDPSVITRGPAGYTLTGVVVDAEDLSAAAQAVAGAAPAAVVATADAALALWRGDAYADLRDVPTLEAEVARLDEDRLRLHEARAAALLDLGRHDEAQAVLATLVGDNPFRERLWSLLAIALYRCDRQAEALETLRRLRTALVDELGVDPSPSVRTLEEDLLAQAPHLDAPLASSGPAPADATRTHASGVVGRSSVLTALDSTLGRLVDDGRGGVLVLTGEAGIGKSMLAAELARRAQARGVRVALGRCHEADLAPAYWPWLPVLRSLAGSDAPAEVALLVGDQGAVAPEAMSAGAAALRTYDAATRVLAAVPGPLLVVLEDVHWSDASSLRLLAYAAEALREEPVLIAVTARDVAPGAHPALTTALAGLARLGAQRLRVPHLGTEAVTELLLDEIDEPDAELAEVLWQRTDGNPFYVLEMARLLRATGEPTAERARALEVPDGIADVVRLRALQLGEAAREALGVASVVGREFDAEVVDSALGRPSLLELDEALGAGVVTAGDEAGRYRFVHALTRETVYGDLRPGARAQWHARVGTALAERLPRRPELRTEVAHHFTRAAAYLPDLVDPAVEHSHEAAMAAEQRGAFVEASDLWTRALDVERCSPAPDPERRHRLLLSSAIACQRLGDIRGAQQVLDEAVERARVDGDHRRVAEAVTGFRAFGVWHWRDMGSADPRTQDTILDCLEHVTNPPLRAQLWASLSLERYVGYDSLGTDEAGERSVELARECGDPEALRFCLEFRCIALYLPGKARELEARAREYLALELSAEREIAARFHLAIGLHRQGRAAEADAEMVVALELAARLRHSGCDVPLAWWRWLRATETGDPEADEIGRQALALHRRTSVVGLEELTGLILLERQARSAVPADVVVTAEANPNRSYRTYVAHALARSGDHEAALRLMGEPSPPHENDYASHFANCLRVEVLVMAGAVHELPDALARIAPYVEEMADYGSVLSAGSTAYFAGIAHAALGERGTALELLRRAVEVNAAAGSGRWERHSRRALAELEQADKSPASPS